MAWPSNSDVQVTKGDGFNPETNILRGSLDLLAGKGRSDTVFLVACTLAPPKEEDFGNLLNAQGILEREVFDGTSVRVVPVLFTGARGQPSVPERTCPRAPWPGGPN